MARPRLGRDPEQACHEGGLSPHITPANVPNLPLSDHRHSLVASQCSSRGWQATEAETRLLFLLRMGNEVRRPTVAAKHIFCCHAVAITALSPQGPIHVRCRAATKNRDLELFRSRG